MSLKLTLDKYEECIGNYIAYVSLFFFLVARFINVQIMLVKCDKPRWSPINHYRLASSQLAFAGLPMLPIFKRHGVCFHPHPGRFELRGFEEK